MRNVRLDALSYTIRGLQIDAVQCVLLVYVVIQVNLINKRMVEINV